MQNSLEIFSSSKEFSVSTGLESHPLCLQKPVIYIPSGEGKAQMFGKLMH
jgi:hypothetical protein